MVKGKNGKTSKVSKYYANNCSQFFSNKTHFYDWVANNLINFWVTETMEQHFIFFNIEILGFQFEPTKTVQSRSGESWEIVSQQMN